MAPGPGSWKAYLAEQLIDLALGLVTGQQGGAYTDGKRVSVSFEPRFFFRLQQLQQPFSLSLSGIVFPGVRVALSPGRLTETLTELLHQDLQLGALQGTAAIA